MAIAFDANLGTNTANGSSVTLTTSAVAAANSRIFLWLCWNGAGVTLSSVSGGSLSWTIHGQTQHTAVNNHFALISAAAPAGLASSTVITPSYSGAVTAGLISAFSVTGVGGIDGSAAVATPTAATGWSTSVTPSGTSSLIVGGCSFDTTTAATNTATSPSTEVHDFSQLTFAGVITTEYRIESSGGSKTVAGTWSSVAGASGQMATISAAFLDAGGPSPAPQARPLLPMLHKFSTLKTPQWPIPVPVTAPTNVTIPQAMTADNVIVTATLATVKTIGQALTATAVAVTGSIQKQVNKLVTATTVAVSGSIQKQVNKTLTATTVAVTATLQALKVILKALTATTVVVTASMVRQVNKLLTATAVVVTAARQLQVNKKLTATTIVVTATLQALKVIVKAMTATAVAVTASMSRRVNTTIAATLSVTATAAKTITKTLTGTVSAIGSLLTSFIPAGGAVGFLGMFRSNQAGASGDTVDEANMTDTLGGASGSSSDEGGFTSTQGGRMGSTQ